MKPAKGHEPRQCPPEFQERIDAIAGFNKFGGPNFKIAWGQSEFIRQGNIWIDRQGTERVGYADRYLAGGTPSWCILRWRDPGTFGNPDMYYWKTYIDGTGMFATGEFPWEGRYEVMQALNYKDFVDGQMVIHAMPLSHILIDQIIPMILKGENLTKEEQALAQEMKAAAKKAEHDAEIDEITASMMENLPVWYGSVSYTGQGCRTSVLTKKQDQIQKYWNGLAKNNSNMRDMLGFHQGQLPRVRK